MAPNVIYICKNCRYASFEYELLRGGKCPNCKEKVK